MVSPILRQKFNLVKLFGSIILITFIVLLLAKSEAGVALAQGGGAYGDGNQAGEEVGDPTSEKSGPPKPDEKAQKALQSLANSLGIGVGPKLGSVDGSFEFGIPNPAWTESSTNFGTPLCDAGCGPFARTGAVYAWFGGTNVYEEGRLTQVTTIPLGSTTLSFYLWVPICDSPSDYLEVLIDGSQVFLLTGSSGLCSGIDYSQQTVDVTAFSDGGLHTVEFHSEIFANNGGPSNFFVDDVFIDVPVPDCKNVSGNPFKNCSFETGNFSNWVTTDMPIPFFPLQVDVDSVSPGFGLFASAPTQGSFAALHGFDGNGPRQEATCSFPNLAIPDGNPVGITNSIAGSALATNLSDLDVFVAVTHTWVGDITSRVIHSATAPLVINRPGEPALGQYGCWRDNIFAVLDDEAASRIEDECANSTPTIAGYFRPNSPLSAFDGQSFNGTWTLQIADTDASFTGTLDAWCLAPSIIGPKTIRLAQDVTLPLGTPVLEFDYRAGWDQITYASITSTGRDFVVTVEPSGGGAPLASILVGTAPVFTFVGDTGFLHGRVDLAPFAGSNVRISFDWIVQDNFAGPAFFQLDNVYVNAQASTVYLPILTKPGPAKVLITNDTGGSLTYQIPNPGNPAPPEGTISCTVPAGAAKFPCNGSFTPGPYTWRATGSCGIATGTRNYDAGDNDIPAFFCK